MQLPHRKIEARDGLLGDLMTNLIGENNSGLDKIRSVLAMRMAQYNDIQFTEEELTGIATSFINIELGSSSNLVMICDKKKCLYKARCILYTSSNCPVGRDCIYENKVQSNAIDQYVSSLNVDITNFPEMVLINQLAEFELIEHRCNAILASDHINLKMKSIIGIDGEGNVVTKEDVSHALNIKMQIFKNKIQLLESFTATRKEKYKKQAALKEVKEGHATVISSMKKKLQELSATTVISSETVYEEMNLLSGN